MRKNIEEQLNKFSEGTINFLGEEAFQKSCTNNHYNQEEISFVYFLKNKDTGLTKIGSTKNLERRMKELKTTFKNMLGITPNLELEYLVLCNKGEEQKVEKSLHRVFKEYRTFGEWFKNLEDEEYFIDILSPVLYTKENIGICLYDGFIEDDYIENVKNLKKECFFDLTENQRYSLYQIGQKMKKIFEEERTDNYSKEELLIKRVSLRDKVDLSEISKAQEILIA